MSLKEEVYEIARLKVGQRKGQALMNALFEVNPELMEEISLSEADCFFDDSRIPAFCKILDDHK
jgi:hypothetical protein